MARKFVTGQGHALRDSRLSMAAIWASMAFFAVQAAYTGLTYIYGDLAAFDPLFRDKYAAHLWLVRTHGTAAALALCLGLVTFLRFTRRLRVHAAMGRIYGAAVMIAGLTALPMAMMAEGGASSRLAFLLQATLWLASMGVAGWAARGGRFALHRRFMVRNYALSYSAVISRLLLNGLQQGGMDFSEIYPALSWTWVCGLAVGEWWIWYSARLSLSPSSGPGVSEPGAGGPPGWMFFSSGNGKVGNGGVASVVGGSSTMAANPTVSSRARNLR